MASSMQQKYQVFISFRGEDTRLNFTSHLCEALKRKGIRYFIDDQLIRGEEISPALLTAIEESTISIIVLSKDYASSSWCLEELSKILECKKRKRQIVVPIFYHVDPSDVRNQKGKSFEDAFEKHQERFKDRTDKVETWRAALKEVANLSGCHIHGQTKDRCESEHIKNIVEDIANKLIDNPSNHFKGLVGIDSSIKEIESMLCFKLVDVRILGICGMGGIGKTTIAEVIYHRNSARFEGCYFLRNVKEESEKYGWICLRDGLLCNILEENNLNIGTNLLSPSICDRLRRKKVLIVLDDVDKSMQLDLFREKHCFGLGSTIIITSRDKQVLRPVVDEIYEVKGLNDNEALQLFNLSTFKQSHPKEGFMELSKKVVHYAKGVPLALCVLGSTLYGRSKLFWEGELNKLTEIPDTNIDNILKISFDGLDREVKDIFLDIACFFKGHDRDYIKDILDGCYRSVMSGISVLIDKSLITLSNNMINMHDLLQQMAWNIICQESKEPGRRSRLWTPKDIIHVLKNNMGTESVEGMFLDMSKISQEKVSISPTAFGRMSKLKRLKFYYSGFRERKVYLSQQGLESLPCDLCYLHWDDYPSKSLPLNFCPENLVELSICNSHVERLWNGVQNLVKLKWLDLTNSKHLIEIPDLSRAIDLERMELAYCTSLVDVPSSIRYLNKLSLLDLNGCSNITKFPEVPGNLKHLYLSGTAIEEVPSTIQCLNKLSFLYLDGCSNITKFPEVPGNLERLYLSGTAIGEVPSSIGCLSRLQHLALEGCRRLERLPSTIGKLKSLEWLFLSNCPNITKFPEIPWSSRDLTLSGTAIEQVPSSIECLSELESLELNDCAKLCSLPIYLFESKPRCAVIVSGISKLEYIQEHLGTVQRVNIRPLDGTGETGNMKSDFSWLVSLSLSSNLSLNDLGILRNNIGNMKSLKELSVSGTSVFEELPNNLENLEFLTKLCLSFCNLCEFSSRLTCMSWLRELNLSGNNFETVPTSIKQLLKLEKLDLSFCKRLQSLPLPPNLYILDAQDCTLLEAVSSAFPISCHRIPHLFLFWDVQTFLFTNCINLNQGAILDKTRWRIQGRAAEDVKRYHEDKAPYLESSFFTCFPGSDIPKWFSNQNLGSSVKFPESLPLHEDKFVGFALCAVVLFKDYNELGFTVCCQGKFKTNGDDCHYFFWNISDIPRLIDSARPWPIGSDHVFLSYNFNFYRDWHSRGKYHLNEASFEFFALNSANDLLDSGMVKKCGVCLLYAQNEIEIDSESDNEVEECNPLLIQPSSPNDPMVEDGTTTKRTRDDCYKEAEAEPSGNFRSNEEEEPHPKRLK